MDVKRKINISLILEKNRIPKEIINLIIDTTIIKELKLSREYHIYNYTTYLRPNLSLLNQIKYITKWESLFNK